MSMSSENDAKLRTLSAFLKIYPSSRLDEEGLTIYLLMLADVSAAELSVAMQKIARHSKFFPAVSEILDTVKQLRQLINPSGRVPSADEAWYEVMGQIQQAYPYKQPSFSTPEIRKAVHYIGWSMICETPAGDMSIVRAHFRDIYQNMLQRGKDEQETRAILAALPAGKKGDIVRRALAAKTM